MQKVFIRFHEIFTTGRSDDVQVWGGGGELVGFRICMGEIDLAYDRWL